MYNACLPHCFSCDQPAVPLTCPSNEESEAKQNNYCGWIKDQNGPFGLCVAAVDPEYLDELFETCVIEVCNNFTVGHDSACNALTGFEFECGEMFLKPDPSWRSDFGCPRKSVLHILKKHI